MIARRPIRCDAERGGSEPVPSAAEGHPPREPPAADVGAAGRERRRAGQRGSRGFTIVELLATLVLVGIVLPVVVQGILLCLNTAGFATQQAEAAALARSKLAELVATGQWYQSEMEGDFGEDRPEYEWVATLEEWEDSRLARLDVFVTWTRRQQERQVVLSTLIYTDSTHE